MLQSHSISQTPKILCWRQNKTHSSPESNQACLDFHDSEQWIHLTAQHVTFDSHRGNYILRPSAVLHPRRVPRFVRTHHHWHVHQGEGRDINRRVICENIRCQFFKAFHLKPWQVLNNIFLHVIPILLVLQNQSKGNRGEHLHCESLNTPQPPQKSMIDMLLFVFFFIVNVTHTD